ncbi:uncharacterized protein TRIVIDRAFT_68438 [Trichoderma virens Gv29-8]|uniref:DUF7896 domain-containing protein n=1 Tax=Hypocrea virens (strain Gv29-8 / FGSC 10586) TaxID=413071 RepID=G9N491_HYPVG|nr:uncharacterized protein TRIVIDRAFT_68438 [Trichoderma virens Gv29-8]EHK18417.1 hypothetical protein TRIVIDRAFT_68438 [Trichoderma virens Gv29-8]
MAYNMEPSPKSIQGTMNFLSRSTLELPFQSPTQSAMPFSPDFAANSSALPYSVNMNQDKSHTDHVFFQQQSHQTLLQQGRALSQAAHYSLAPPPMHRDMSICSEPIMRYRQTTPSAPTGRRISHEMPFAPLAQVQENASSDENASPDVGVTPQAYFANMAQSYLSSTGTNLPLHDMFAGRQSATPSMVTASTGTELAPPMTRENSFVLASPGVNITRMPSSASYADLFPGHGASDFQQPSCSNPSKMPEELLAVGGGFSNFPTMQYPTPEYQMLASPTFAPTPMERVDSTCSTKSTASSVERRAREARERVLLQAQSTSIAPIPQPLPREPAQPALGKRSTQQVAKVKQKPKHPKLRCSYCNEIPDGFRGDHELRRHISAKHVRIVKKYVCRDPREAGMRSGLKPLNPLSRCKACASGKQYNAYYNAAAHLRRTHFRVKPIRGKGATAISERRGGKGGGDWPPMPDLKAWFVEIEVESERPTSVVTGDDPPEEGSLSPASTSATHMGTNADSFGEDDFTSDIMPVSYMEQSTQEDSQFALLSALDEGDADMLDSSQDSATSDFQSMNNMTFDIPWFDDTDLGFPSL